MSDVLPRTPQAIPFPPLEAIYLPLAVEGKLGGFACGIVEGNPVVMLRTLPLTPTGFLLAFLLRSRNPSELTSVFGAEARQIITSSVELWRRIGVPRENLLLCTRSPLSAISMGVNDLFADWQAQENPRAAMRLDMQRLADLLDEIAP